MKDRVVPISKLRPEEIPNLVWMFARKWKKGFQYLAEFQIDRTVWTWHRPYAYWLESTEESHVIYQRLRSNVKRMTQEENPEVYMISTETAEVLAEQVHIE